MNVIYLIHLNLGRDLIMNKKNRNILILGFLLGVVLYIAISMLLL